jgi:diguanylate cyclase (GGDEF)-like protein/PAS domain S-box-containing protein
MHLLALGAVAAGLGALALTGGWASAGGVPVEVVLLFTGLLLLFVYSRYRSQRAELEALAARAAREVESRFVDLFRFAEEAVFLLDDSGAIIEANQRAVDVYGYDHAQLVGMNIERLRAPDARGGVAGDVAYVREHGNLRRETVHVRKDGTCFPVEYSASAINLDGRPMFQDIVRDISERQRADEQVRAATAEMSRLIQVLEEKDQQNTLLSEMREFLLACSTPSEIGPVVARAMVQLFPGLEGALLLLSPSRTDLETVSRWGGYPEAIEDNLFGPDSCWALRRVVRHVVDDEPGGLRCQHMLHSQSTGSMCVPLMARGDVIGLLHLRRPVGGDASGAPLAAIAEFATTVSEILSLSIWNIRLRETLSHQAIRDPLTGLFNRNFMEEALQREIFRASRLRTSIGIVMVDVDRFKRFNDVHGHAAGDQVLVELANLFRWQLRRGDIVCRYGGEEFVLILPDSTIEKTAWRANELREGVKGIRVTYAGQEIGPISVSMGVSALPIHGTRPTDLLRAADLALYRAKQEGRDRVVCQPPGPVAEADPADAPTSEAA